ncbi:MAG: pectate lyase [Chitinispirillaceae bacterium]|nr:pectate lyase [Chitinispirillaceae bacterium]
MNINWRYNLLLLFSLPAMVSAVVPAEFQTLLSGQRSFSNLTNAAAGNNETYGMNITTWQMPHGGFCKAMESRYQAPWNGTEPLSDFTSNKGPLGMFDNNATIGELRFLANLYKSTSNAAEKTAFKTAVNKIAGFILASQYPSGGWPQMYPAREGTIYSNYVTYNDDAMVRIMVALQDIIDKKSPFDSDIITADTLSGLKTALEKGVQFTLKAQIINNEERTVWCAQHDPATYEPLGARSYELPSKSGSESVGIAAFLLNYSSQTPEIAAAYGSAINWFRITCVKDTACNRGTFFYSQGAMMWYRFYNVEDNRPFFCGRDGVKKYDIMEIEEERRTGYSWAGSYAESLVQLADKYELAPVSPRNAVHNGKRFFITVSHDGTTAFHVHGTAPLYVELEHFTLSGRRTGTPVSGIFVPDIYNFTQRHLAPARYIYRSRTENAALTGTITIERTY